MRDKTNEPTLAQLLFDFCGNPSSKDMAKALCVSAAYVSDLKNGRRDWSPALINRAAARFDMSPYEVHTLHRMGALEAGWRI